MGLFSALGALGKVAGAIKALMQWLDRQQAIEAGRNEVRADMADQQEMVNEKSRKARATVRNGDDARRLRRRRHRNRNKE